ncbi:GlsB/YeaQ/YmgE family stress response membrane protein [Gleimia sp. 6138-11-ORH1]|uniref:GlsB/YeaQ/YmgE family stress response membrane protein n=1 Tax=Gleimia sp. 6138-11-ORH1 TaxID=2973937 RepID=UPI00216816B0|nr:GlsB/YeaQ/YmgE family stress response membrane protein [Gleimia sp. 6138-11-ORH1]MCS4484694.1 GlsB/YeaQ/YmgE family stress response membrane protein [Gleimia sp. 6138-11-ORH1]
MGTTGIVGFIVIGALLGAIARLFMKGNETSILVWTVSLGTLGSFLGGWTAGISLTRPGGIFSWIAAVLTSLFLLGIYGFFNTKRK